MGLRELLTCYCESSTLISLHTVIYAFESYNIHILIKEQTITIAYNYRFSPNERLATTTLAPFSFPPKASAFPAPPAPMTTNSLPANGEPDPLLAPFDAVYKNLIH